MDVDIRTTISVVESIGSIHLQDPPYQDDGENVFSVFSIIVQDRTGSRSLLRYPPDFAEFHTKIKEVYDDVKIPFPNFITFSVNRQTQNGIRRMLQALSHLTAKSNAEKAENYLQRCLLDATIGKSSILRDFLSLQREEDTFTPMDTASETIAPQSPMPVNTDVENEDALVPEAIDYEDISSFSLGSRKSSGNFSNTNRFDDDVPNLANVNLEYFDDHPDSPSFNDVFSLSNYDEKGEHTSITVIDQYDILKVLGQGCMGKVMLVRNSQKKKKYALKAIAKETVLSQREIAHTLSERDILVDLAMFSHPFLIKLHHAFQDPFYLFLVLDYHPGGDIANQMSLRGVFSPERTLFYAAEIVEGLGELHRRGIMYRDLKPENILLGSSGHIVLTDFGLSKSFTLDELAAQPMSTTFCGTAEYLAPEMLLNEPHSFTVDYWSLGTILYEMLVGCTPFYAQTTSLMYHRVLEDELIVPRYLDDITVDFLSGLLTKDQYFRLGSCGIDEIKSHPYFSDINWQDVVDLELEPPFVPAQSSIGDLSNVDETFLKMNPHLSACAGIDKDLQADFDILFKDYNYISSEDSPTLDANVPDIESTHELPGLNPVTAPVDTLKSGGKDSASITSFLRKHGSRKRSSVDMLSDSYDGADCTVKDSSYDNSQRPSKRHHSESFDTACSMNLEVLEASVTVCATDDSSERDQVTVAMDCEPASIKIEPALPNTSLPKSSGFKTVFARHLKTYSIFKRGAKYFFAHFHRG